jgi:hypothetical protein
MLTTFYFERDFTFFVFFLGVWALATRLAFADYCNGFEQLWVLEVILQFFGKRRRVQRMRPACLGRRLLNYRLFRFEGLFVQPQESVHA